VSAPARLFGSRAVIATAAALGLGLIGYALFSRQTDEERIADVMAQVAEAVGFESPPNPLTHAAALRGRFADLVASNVIVDVPERNLIARGRDDLTRLAIAGTARMQRFDVSFTLENLTVHGDTATASVEVLTEAAHGNDPRMSTRHADLEFVKTDGDWQLSRAHVLEASDE
jgi:ketosteroid isomerase-like protein